MRPSAEGEEGKDGCRSRNSGEREHREGGVSCGLGRRIGQELWHQAGPVTPQAP